MRDGRLHQILGALNAQEADAARQLLGLSLFVGASGLAVLRHFLDSLLMFGLGRLLVLFVEWIGMPPAELDLIHALSKWYEIALFGSFAAFSLFDVFQVRFGRRLHTPGESA